MTTQAAIARERVTGGHKHSLNDALSDPRRFEDVDLVIQRNENVKTSGSPCRKPVSQVIANKELPHE